MKTKEFIEKVEELGYSVSNTDYAEYLYNKGDLLGLVQNNKQYKLTVYDLFKEKNARELFNLCVEYARTPIKERKEEEKFYLQKMKSFYENVYDEKDNFLNFGKSRNIYFLFNKDQCDGCQTQFTQREIDKIKEEQHTDLSEFKQIPVEEVEA
jgi:hypothetical protein